MDKLGYNFSSVQIPVSSGLEQHAKAWVRRTVSPSDLYRPNDPEFGTPKNIHVTVRYGLHDPKPSKVFELVKDAPPVKYELGKVSVFENKDFDVLKVEVKSKDLHNLHNELGACKNTKTFKDYKPHLTLAYLKKGTGKKYTDTDEFEGIKGTERRLEFSGKTGIKATKKLGGAMKLAEAIAIDAENMAQVKLAAYRRSNGKRRRRREGPDYGRYVAKGIGAGSGALIGSIISDVKTKPVEHIKDKIYSLLDNAFGKLLIRRGLE